MAVASAEPYANHLHLGPHRKPHQDVITQFLQAGCSSWRPTNSVTAIKWMRRLESKFLSTDLNEFTHVTCTNSFWVVHCLTSTLLSEKFNSITTSITNNQNGTIKQHSYHRTLIGSHAWSLSNHVILITVYLLHHEQSFCHIIYR